MDTHQKIWALLDERAGNTSQTLGVAEALGMPYETRQIIFNNWIKLPNFFHTRSTLGVHPSCLGALSPPWPDIVISSARRLGLVASYIKSRSPKTFLAQVQWPGYPASQYDLIATPLHDHKKPAANLMTTLGAPHRVNETLLKREAAAWASTLAHLPAPKIAVLIGGGGSSRDFAGGHAEKIARAASSLAHSLGGSLFITTSRRTGTAMADALPAHLTCPYYLHRFHDGDEPDANPYYGFLGLADAIIATGDSVSMCSEACATGKPVYIYESADFVAGKHRAFIQSLYDARLARPLLISGNTAFTPAYRLDDAAAIAAEIKKRIA